MPTELPPRQRRPAPPSDDEEHNDEGDTLVPVLIICTLLLVNIALYFDKFTPPGGFTLAASPMELQLSP